MISANTLFHFTSSIENISNILSNNFIPRYCLEKVDFIPNMNLDYAYPMVCFCDIPLSQITEHISTYGSYAIGLKKEWAMPKSISPVIYLHNNSQTISIIDRLFKSSAIFDRLEKLITKTNLRFAARDTMELLFYCKTYKGSMWRNGVLKENITFYNEREWRYVPPLAELELINPRFIINKDEFDNTEIRNRENDLIKNFQIHFTPDDIKYLIIKYENERLRLVQMIQEIKGNLFNVEQLKVLSSKIISVEQIKEDF